MTGERRITVSPIAAAAAFVIALVAGAGGTYLIMRGYTPDALQTTSGTAAGSNGPVVASPPSAASPASALAGNGAPAPVRDVVVALAPEAVARAGIEVTQVSTGAAVDHVRLPGMVEPNAYRQVGVTPLVGGRVVRVYVQLGDRVRRGQALAQVYSPELAEARTKYLAAKAMLDAHDRELQRTEKLVEIGAASRQELERIHAEHAAQTAEVESARSRLQLLGAADEPPGSKPANEATVDVPAPIDGVVTERIANDGLNLDPTTRLFTIVDLSTVWIVADVYERDLHRIREGARASVTTTAYPDLSLEGRVSYIDPQLSSTTRTAKVRVEVANPRRELRLGMYAEVAIESANATPVLSVPKGAVQNVADRQVVYVPVPRDPAKFIERAVRVGRASGNVIEVVSGLEAGDAVVSTGSFFLRAEAERLGLRSSERAVMPGAPPASGSTSTTAEMQTAKIAVTENGFEPAKVNLRAGVPARLTFVRTTDKTCGTEVVFPSLNIKRALPLNEAVDIEFTTPKSTEIAFACGMNMLHGTVVVQ